jgi:DNA-binding IclR family transcriptional regulator
MVLRKGVAGESDTGTLGKLMSLLDLITHADRPLRFTDILAAARQPRGTLHRQLSHLVEEGLLEIDTEGRYSPGLRLLDLASRSWAKNEFRLIAEPHLRELQKMSGETVHLGVLKGSSIIYLDKVEGQQPVRMYSQIGNAAGYSRPYRSRARVSALHAQYADVRTGIA